MNWYTVYLRKTGELAAAGTAEMCTRQLGYASTNSFYSTVTHTRKLSGMKKKLQKYDFVVEPLTKKELDEYHADKRKALRCDSTEGR